jgi:hypothetical protein
MSATAYEHTRGGERCPPFILIDEIEFDTAVALGLGLHCRTLSSWTKGQVTTL